MWYLQSNRSIKVIRKVVNIAFDYAQMPCYLRSEPEVYSKYILLYLSSTDNYVRYCAMGQNIFSAF